MFASPPAIGSVQCTCSTPTLPHLPACCRADCTWDFSNAEEVYVDDVFVGFSTVGSAGDAACKATALQLNNPSQASASCGEALATVDSDGVYFTPHLGCSGATYPVRYQLVSPVPVSLRAISFGYISDEGVLPFTAKLSCTQGAPVQVTLRAGSIPVGESGDYTFSLSSLFTVPGGQAGCQLELSSGRTNTEGTVCVKTLSQVTGRPPPPPSPPSPPPLPPL